MQDAVSIGSHDRSVAELPDQHARSDKHRREDPVSLHKAASPRLDGLDHAYVPIVPRVDKLSFRNALDREFLSQDLAPFPLTLRSLASGPTAAILFP
jgi:hypothetical protein